MIRESESDIKAQLSWDGGWYFPPCSPCWREGDAPEEHQSPPVLPLLSGLSLNVALCSSWGVQAILLSKPMAEICLWRSISCASRASLAVWVMPSSSAGAGAVMEGHPSSAGLGVTHRVCMARLSPQIHISTVCFSTLWPANICSRAGQSHAADKPAAEGWRGDTVPKSSPNCASGSQENGWCGPGSDYLQALKMTCQDMTGQDGAGTMGIV